MRRIPSKSPRFFGFTMYPDVCPTTLGNLKLIKQQLGKDADQLRVILVSLDPERDTPDILKQYTQAFGGDFIGAATDLTPPRYWQKTWALRMKKSAAKNTIWLNTPAICI